MGKRIAVAGALIALAGAVGLLFFGPDVLQVFQVVLASRGPGVPLAEVTLHLGIATCSAAALALGVVVALAGLASAAQGRGVAVFARGALALAAAAAIASGALTVWGMETWRQHFAMLASSDAEVTGPQLQRWIDQSRGPLNAAFLVLPAAPVLLLVSAFGIGRVSSLSGPAEHTRGLAALSVLAGAALAAAFLLIWWQTWQFGSLSGAGTVRASEVVACLDRVLLGSYAAGVSLALLGAVLGYAALGLPSRDR